MEKNEAYKFLEDDSKGFTKESAMAFLDGGVKPKGIITPKKEPVGHYEGWIKPTLDEYWKGVKATPETAAAIGTGVLAWGSSAITGVANIAAGKSGEETEKAMARTAETIQYQPKGEVAQQAAGMVGKGMEKALWPATMAKEQVARNKWGKKAEILTGLGSEIAMFWMAGKVGGKIKTHSKQRATSKAILDEKLSKLTSEQRTYVNEVAKEQIIHHQGEAPKLDQTFAAHEEGAKFAEGIKKDAETLTGQKALPEGKPQLPVKRGSVIELPHEVQLKDPKIIKPELQKKLPAPKGQKQLPPGQGFTMVSAKKFLEEKPKEPIKAEKPTVSETIKKAEDLSKQFKTKKDELTEILDGIQKRVSKKKVVPVKEAPVKGKESPRYAQETLFGKDKTQIQPELPLKKKQNILKSQKGEVEIDIKAIKEGIKRVVEDLEESPTGKGIKEASKKLTGAAKETFRSPEDVYAPDPVGRKIYQRMDRADQRRNAFAAEQGELFKKAVGDIKGESISSKRIGMALDGKIPRSELTLKQRKAYDFFQEQYQFLIQKYARTAAGTEEGYLKVLKASNRKNPIQVKVSELSEPLQKKYGVLKNRLDKIRKGRALKDLGADEKVYWDTRKEMLRTLNKGWTEKLTAGERKAFDVLSRRIKDYLPHMFERTELLADFKTEISTINSKLRTATNKGAITQYKNRLKQLEDAVIRLEKGYMVTFESLPQNVRFKYFESRKGKAGYSFDAIKAYQSYLDGITKKIYIEPAIKEVAQLHKELSPELKSYNKTFIRKYMGWDVSKWDSAAGAIASAQWMRTLGLNPRSAIVNLTQRMNTIVEVGERQALGRPILSALHLKKGEILGYTKEGTKLFDATGISKEIPQVLMEGAIPKSMESMKNVLGYMFHKIEIGNRKHAFLSGYSLAKSGKISPQMAKRYDIKNPKKMTEAECVQFGVDVAHKTQFRYGKIGMPMGLRHPVGRLALQFWSYPIKQTEYMVGLLKSDPKKLIKLIAYAEGSKYVLDEFLNTDLSNALGFGITWGEIIKAAQAVPEGDWRKFLRHAKLTFGGGGGVLPSGLGPTATGASKVAASIRKGRGFQTLKRELTPVQWKRFSQAYDALKNRKGNKYPIYDSRKHLMYYVTSKELAMRTVGPRPAKESKQWIEYQKGQLLEQERGEVLQDIINAMVDGNSKKANKLMNRYQIEPTDQAIEAEILKRKLTRKERKSLKDFGKPEEYQYQREGKTY